MSRVSDAPSGAAVIEVTGDNDAFDADRLERALAELGRVPALIDLRAAKFVDSTFVGMLLKANAESKIAVVIPTEPKNPVARVFELTHLAETLPVYESYDDGLLALDGA